MRQKKILILDFLLTFTVCAIFWLIIGIVLKVNSYKKSQEAYDTVKNTVVTDSTDALSREIDFSVLETETGGACSWIYIPDTPIDYPIVQGIDNEIYLEYDAYGNKSSSGAIFLNYANSPDLTDVKSVIYGHSMKDGSMFHCLHDYKDPTFAKEHSSLYIYTDTAEIKEYTLLCTLRCDSKDSVIYECSAVERIDDVTDYLISKADAVYAESSGGNVVLLSTCISGNSRRVVVFQEYVPSEM